MGLQKLIGQVLMRVWRIATGTPSYTTDDLHGLGAKTTGGRRDRAGSPVGWDALPTGKVSLDYGDAWLTALASALLVVPSIVVPANQEKIGGKLPRLCLPPCWENRRMPPIPRSAILLIGGDKTGDDRWYDVHVPIADRLCDEHLEQLRKEGQIDG